VKAYKYCMLSCCNGFARVFLVCDHSQTRYKVELLDTLDNNLYNRTSSRGGEEVSMSEANTNRQGEGLYK